MILQAIIVQCDHVDEKGQRDCPEWELAGTAPNEKGEQQVLFPGYTKEDAEKGNVWAMKAPSAILAQGQAQVPLFYCPSHSPKPQQPAQQQPGNGNGQQRTQQSGGRSFRRG